MEKEELREIIRESYENIYEENLGELRRLKEKNGRKEEIEKLEEKCQKLESRMERIGMCGEIIYVKNEQTGEYEATSFPCQLRLCPVCQERKKEKNIEEFLEIVEVARERHGYILSIIELSNGYYDFDEISDVIKETESAFRKLCQRVAVKKAIKGFTRIMNVEYSPNKKQYKVFINMFIVTNKSYKNDNKIYISNKKWRQIWMEHLPEHLRDEANVLSLSTNVDRKEMTSYKHLFDYTNLNNLIQEEADQKKIDKLVEDFDSLITSKRMITYGRALKEIRSELKKETELMNEEDEE